jgi:hypothetical protein
LDQAHRTVHFGRGPELWQRHQVIATETDRDHAGTVDREQPVHNPLS